ncbi:MAG: 1,6-anhydro-N-acetylmuramyl-L-alanine amidase AmpD [Thalassolituus sp.]
MLWETGISVIIQKGRLDVAAWVASPNFGSRPDADDISLLVVHNISLPPGQFGTGCVQRFFCNELDSSEHPYFEEIAGLQVSSHLLIERSGDIFQFVNFNDRAWHAGMSEFAGRDNCNDYSIGIELEGTDTYPYSDEQYLALAQITGALMAYYPRLTVDRITGHENIAPGRKTDPGPAFDWDRYRAMLESEFSGKNL